jgi:hypothetical protein
MPDLHETNSVDALVRGTLDALDPGAQDRDLLLTRRLLGEQGARTTPATRTTPAPWARRLTARRVALVAALAAAVAVAVAVAPGGSDPSDRSAFSPTAAQAALLDAAAAAGNEPWSPLGADDYFHVSSRGYNPRLDDVEGSSPLNGGVNGGEAWFSRDGRGRSINVSGGSGDPARPPSIYRDPKTGKARGFGASRPAPGATVDFDDAMRLPDLVNVMTWPRDGTPPVQRAWVRTRSGFELTDELEMSAENMGSSQAPDAIVTGAWGASAEAIDAANSDHDPEHAVEQLLAHAPSARHAAGTDGNPTTKTIEVPAGRLQIEARIEHASELLASAPLSPDVRHAMWTWLASQDGATIEHDVVDEIGRTGTQITFEDRRLQSIPTYEVTAANVLHDKAVRGIDMNKRYTVRDNSVERIWRVGMLVDVDRGDLLQRYVFETTRMHGKRPHFVTMADGPKILIEDSHGGNATFGGSMTLARDYTHTIEPTLEVCRDHPEVCR